VVNEVTTTGIGRERNKISDRSKDIYGSTSRHGVIALIELSVYLL
jgi:hypothetical protein